MDDTTEDVKKRIYEAREKHEQEMFDTKLTFIVSTLAFVFLCIVALGVVIIAHVWKVWIF